MKAKRLSELSDAEMRALTGTSGVLCDKCGSEEHNTANHPVRGHLADETYEGDPYLAWKKARGEA